MKDRITPNLLVADILNRWPQTIPVFLKYRMSCVGCIMSSFENLDDAIQIYHLPQQQVIADLQQAIRTDEKS